MDLKTQIALALERAAWSAPGPDGKMTPETLSDVQALLLQGREDGEPEATVSGPG